ncbi:phosphoribosylaminoimidazolesuccinocarboxamide synthase [bacterium K02(2017)]|nr:phosphoribosylaminoimidazolesuccinocarboxamide synthase [bacterium K02(2017)]
MYESQIKEIPLLFRGKVRDVYDLGDELVIVTTDRISAFDVILPQPIPHKGSVLTRLTDFWLDRFNGLVPSHRSETKLSDVIKDSKTLEQIKDQAVVVKKAKPLPIECVVRGYLLGTGYKDYKKTGKVCGIELPQNLQLAEQLPEPIFTPATKAEQGDHDENISFEQAVELVGVDLATKVRSLSIKLYSEAARFAKEKGLIIADTKFEFGIYKDELIIIDEVLTCDSSRFWPIEEYKVGISPPSYDKQIVRDYLETLDWDKTDPGPELPDDILQKASSRYLELIEKLTT